MFPYKAVDISDIWFQGQNLKSFSFFCNSENVPSPGSSVPSNSGTWPWAMSQEGQRLLSGVAGRGLSPTPRAPLAVHIFPPPCSQSLLFWYPQSFLWRDTAQHTTQEVKPTWPHGGFTWVKATPGELTSRWVDHVTGAVDWVDLGYARAFPIP